MSGAAARGTAAMRAGAGASIGGSCGAASVEMDGMPITRPGGPTSGPTRSEPHEEQHAATTAARRQERERIETPGGE